MKTPSERFHELIDGVGDERLDAIARRLADPSDPAHAEEVQWRDDPDPFGIDWAWIRLEDEPVITTAPSQSHKVTTADNPSALKLPDRGGRRSYLRFVGYVAAACLLVALGTLLGGRFIGGGGPLLIATSMVPFEDGRGQASQLRITSNRVGFVAVVALLPGEPERPVVFPVSPSPDLGVAPDSPTDTGPFPREARAATVALVVVTRTPAADTIDKALLDTSYSTDQVTRLEGLVADLLRQKGHEQFAIDRIPLGQEQP